MRAKSIGRLILLLIFPAAFAQSGTSDSPVTQVLLTEVRQLRQDLQATAAMIQRVQIVMYRLQAGSVQLDRVKERLDEARGQCEQAQAQRKYVTTAIEQAEARKRDAQNSGTEKAAEASLSQLRSSLEMWAGREQQCQVEQVEAETQVRN